MKFIFKKKFIRRILVGTLILAVTLFIVVFLVVPIVYRSSYAFQRSLLFLNFVSVPADFKNPSKLGLTGTRNFYLKTNDNITLGVWHTLPIKEANGAKGLKQLLGILEDAAYDTALASGDPVFIYMHGNSGNRASSHRVELYKVLQSINCHVISFDYRSYGDSSGVPPSEEGVVNDTKAVFEWVKKRSGNSRIFFWGHSLGTGISSHALHDLEAEGKSISGLVLESPFNNLKEEIESYPLAQLFTFLPWFEYFFTDPMYENGLRFESDKHLSQVKTPLVILHAEDDVVIPFRLGKKLYDTLQKNRGDNGLIQFVPYTKDKKYGHKFIVNDKELPNLIRNFINETKEFKSF